MVEDAEKLDALLVNLVLIFKNAAMQQMGKLINPLTGKVEKNLEQARFSIDMIDMLKQKTRGNLSDEIGKLLDATLLELRMNYVEEADAEAKARERAGDESRATEEAEEAKAGEEREVKMKEAEESKPRAAEGKEQDRAREAEQRRRQPEQAGQQGDGSKETHVRKKAGDDQPIDQKTGSLSAEKGSAEGSARKGKPKGRKRSKTT